MKELVDGVGKPLAIGDIFLYKRRRGWRYGIIYGISLKHAVYTIHVIFARKYYSSDEYYTHRAGLTASDNIYKTTDMPDKVRAMLLRKVFE